MKTLDAVNGVFNGVFIMSYIALLTLLRIFTWGTAVPVVATCQLITGRFTQVIHCDASLQTCKRGAQRRSTFLGLPPAIPPCWSNQGLMPVVFIEALELALLLSICYLSISVRHDIYLCMDHIHMYIITYITFI